VQQRLCAELLRLSRPRPLAAGTTPAQGVRAAADRAEPARVVSPPPPQHDIAARIGARREAVSREMSELERLGLIGRTPGAIVLHAPEALRAMVERGLRDDHSG
jgi:CRP-like cAMP-binding protein